jgi:hypothetical protein
MLRILGFVTGLGLVAVIGLMLLEPPAPSTAGSGAMTVQQHLPLAEALADTGPKAGAPGAREAPDESPETGQAATDGGGRAHVPEKGAESGQLVVVSEKPDSPPMSIPAPGSAMRTLYETPATAPDMGEDTSASAVAEPQERVPSPVPDPVADAQASAAESQSTPQEPYREGLQLLWSPFRTQSAASGFARRLSKLSGVDVRVADAAPGRYRVGFDYPDETQRRSALAQIQARTGLDLGIDLPSDETLDDETLDAGIGAALSDPMVDRPGAQ